MSSQDLKSYFLDNNIIIDPTKDYKGNSIKVGDRVKIVGDCKYTNMAYSCTKDMYNMRDSDNVYIVKDVQDDGKVIIANGWMWFPYDLLVISDKNEKVEIIPQVFQFNVNLL